MVASSSLSYPVVAAPVIPTTFSWGGGGATAITVDTPPDVLPNTSFYVTGTFIGTPLGMNYSTNGGGTYQPCQSLSLDSFGNYSFILVGGLAIGTYTLKVQDSILTGNVGTAGVMNVAAFNPAALLSGSLLWDHDPNDRTVTSVNGYSGASGLTLIGLVNSIYNKQNNRQFMPAQNGPTAPPINLLRGQGSDNLHTVLAMNPRKTTPLSTYDPTTNCFQAGGPRSSCAGIIQALAALPGGSTMALTCITAVRFDATQGYTFNAGLLGIAIPSNPNRPFIQLTPRNDTTKLGGEIVDNAGNLVEGDSATYPPAPGWYVLTTLVGGGTITTRVNKTAGTPVAAGAALSVNLINEFSLGGDGGTNAILNGAPYLYYGRQQLYIGTLTGADLTGAETQVGHSVGINI